MLVSAGRMHAHASSDMLQPGARMYPLFTPAATATSSHTLVLCVPPQLCCVGTARRIHDGIGQPESDLPAAWLPYVHATCMRHTAHASACAHGAHARCARTHGRCPAPPQASASLAAHAHTWVCAATRVRAIAEGGGRITGRTGRPYHRSTCQGSTLRPPRAAVP